jgi:hypothetical protein
MNEHLPLDMNSFQKVSEWLMEVVNKVCGLRRLNCWLVYRGGSQKNTFCERSWLARVR